MADFVPRDFLYRGGGDGRVLVVKTGTKFFTQGDSDSAAVFYLQHGRAKKTVIHANGKEALLQILEGGVFFGTAGLYGTTPRRSTVTAISPCTITIITKTTMVRTLMTQPSFARVFMEYLLDQNDKIEGEKIDLLLSPTEQRLAQKLLDLSHASTGDPQPIGRDINQEMLAGMIGTTRTRCNYFLSRLRRTGMINCNDGITVLPPLQFMVEKTRLSKLG